MKDFNHLWNDMPPEDRARLMPHMVETQRLHIIQCRAKAVSAHKAHLRELDSWVKNLDVELNKYKRDSHGE